MDFGNKNIKIVLILLSFYLSMTNGINVNCNGKAFHCVNSTHFKICVDLGGGVSTTVDEFILPCPYNTYCKPTNNYECEYYETTSATTIITSELNVINNLEASVIPLFSPREKLEATSDKNIPPSEQDYAAEYDESSVPPTVVTSTPSLTDKKMINHIENHTHQSTTHIIEELNTKDLKNVTNRSIFEATTINNEIKSNNKDFNVLSTTPNNLDHITNLPESEHTSFSTAENLETIFNIKNISAVERLPTAVTSYENSNNNKTSGVSLNLEVAQTSYSTKTNDTFVTKNNTTGINSTYSLNYSDVLDSETIVYHKTNKKIELANIISTPVNLEDMQLLQNITQENILEQLERTYNSTSNMGLLNKIKNSTDNQSIIIKNSHNISSNGLNLTLINDSLRIQRVSTPSLHTTININAEATTMAPVEGNSTSHFSFPLSAIESYDTTVIKTDISNVTDFKNNQINSTNMFFDGNNNSSIPFRVLPTENSVINTTESHEPKLFNNSYLALTTNVIYTTENYNNKQLLQKKLANEIVNSDTNNTLDGLQETTIQSKQNHNSMQNVTTNINFINKTNETLSQSNVKDDLILQDIKIESENKILNVSNINENLKIYDLNSTLPIIYLTKLMPTTEKSEQKPVPNITLYETAHTEDISNSVPRFPLTNNALTKVLFTSTEKYKTTTVSIGSTRNPETGHQEPTAINKATTLSEKLWYVTLLPELFKDNSNNSDIIYFQGNNTTIAYNELPTENPLLSTTETFEPTFLIKNLNESSNAYSTNTPNQITRTEGLQIEHPSVIITQNYETRYNQVTANPIDDTYISNTRSNPYGERISISSEISTNSHEISVTPAPTAEIASITQINENRINNSVSQFTKDFGTTIVDLLTKPKVTLNTKTESGTIILNSSSTPTETYITTTLSENLHYETLPELIKDNSSNSDIYYQRNYTSIAYDMLQTKNPLPSTRQTFKPTLSTLLIIKQNDSSNANSTNAHLTHTTTEVISTDGLPIDHPSIVIAKNYETKQNHVTSAIVDILNTSSNPFEETLSIPSVTTTNVPKIVFESLSHKISVTPAPTAEMATSIQINQNRKINSISPFTRDFDTTIIDLLTTPKLTLNTKTESAAIGDSTAVLGTLSLKTTTPYTYVTINENSAIHNHDLESKNVEEQSDSNLLVANATNKSLTFVSPNRQNTISKLITSNAEDKNFLLTYKNTTIFTNKILSQNQTHNASNLLLNKSTIPQQLIQNITYDSKHSSDTKIDFKTALFNNASDLNETKCTTQANNKTSNTMITDETNIGENKLDKPIIQNNILNNLYVFNQSKELKTNVTNAQLTLSDNRNITTFNSGIRINKANQILQSLSIESNKTINDSSLITSHKGIISEKSQKSINYQDSIISSNPKVSINYDLNNNITRLKNITGESLAAIILTNTSFNSTPYKNYTQSQRITSKSSGNEHSNSNYTQNALDTDCQDRPTGKYADQNDCKKFYLCLGEVQPYIGECPNGTVFSESKKQCTKNLSQCYRNNEFRCLSAGRYYDLRVRNVYYICVQNRGKFIKFKYQCQNGYSLNTTIIQCIQDSPNISIANNSDSSSTNDESTSISLESSSKAVEESKTKDLDYSDDNENEFECKNEGKFPHPNECNKYYVCSKTKKCIFRRRLKKCDSGEVFDKEKQKCVDSDSRECK